MTEKKLDHVVTLPVRWGDMDVYEHVNNTVYFRYAEQARIEWMERLGLQLSRTQSQGPVIVNASCTFFIPITYPSVVEVKVFVGHVGRSSVDTSYEIRVVGDDRLCAEGAARVVWVDVNTGKSCPIPESLKALI